MDNLSDKNNSKNDLKPKGSYPQGTATAPQGTATAPQGTATAPQGTATMPQGTATAPSGGGSAYTGSQAEIVIQKDKVLKVYKSGCSYNAAVLPLVKKLRGKGFVVDLFDYGTMDYQGERRQFELMEYCPEGAVSALNLKGRKDAIVAIVRKVAEALDACHRAGFIHKDVKPANILIRDRKTWDCVLCDFGIADVLEQGKVTTQQSRTPIYAAPEVYERIVQIDNKVLCELTPAADFYSLGMTILCLWYGESAFLSKEGTMAIQKVHDGIVVPTDIPEPLYTLTRGLLVKDPAHRWGWKEVNAYLSGKSVDVYDERREEGLNIVFNSSKHQVAHSVEELAAFMVEDLDLAIKYLYSGKLSKWLEHMPELQIEIENIVEKEFPRNQMMGVLAAIHTLNPFYDLNLCCDIHSPAYAMTGEAIGRLLNEAYYHYFTKGDANPIATLVAESFAGGSTSDYVPWFFNHKGNRFDQQRKWFNYCVHGDAKNAKKAGPKDTNYLHQVAMMKTIAGFGAQPEYRLSRTGEVLRSLDDLKKVSLDELRYDLQHDKGLRGWLAVLCHEDPHADLKTKYSYEKLLERYVNAIGAIDPKDKVFSRFQQAQSEAQGLVKKAKNTVSDAKSSIRWQKALSILFGLIPLAILLTEIILNITDNPGIKLGKWTDHVVFGIGILVAAICFFAVDSNDGCLVPIIIGVVASFVSYLLINVIGFFILYLYAIAVIIAMIYFSLPILFGTRNKKYKIKQIANPGFEELTLEPLYFAFSAETKFDSSLNGAIDIQSSSSLSEAMKKRWKMLLLFLGVVLLLCLLRFALPKSERMDRFDHYLFHPFNSEITQDYDEVSPVSDPEP